MTPRHVGWRKWTGRQRAWFHPFSTSSGTSRSCSVTQKRPHPPYFTSLPPNYQLSFPLLSKPSYLISPLLLKQPDLGTGAGGEFWVRPLPSVCFVSAGKLGFIAIWPQVLGTVLAGSTCDASSSSSTKLLFSNTVSQRNT